MKDFYEQVRGILTEYPRARDDDMYLYAVFVAKTTSVDTGDSFFEVLVNHNKYNLPSYESVTRTRRKVQANEFNLRGKGSTRRRELQAEYKDHYSRR